jgi:transcriptional regulator with XRE-family HTH domain
MNKSFPARLKEIRGKLSLRNFSVKCGEMTETSLRKYEKGASEPTRPKLIQMAEAGDVTVGWLANGEQPKKPGLPASVNEAKAMREEMASNNVQATISPPDTKRQEDQGRRHPALAVLDQWLEFTEKTDPVRSARFLDELCESIPELAEWIKKRPGTNHTSGPSHNTHRQTA